MSPPQISHQIIVILSIMFLFTQDSVVSAQSQPVPIQLSESEIEKTCPRYRFWIRTTNDGHDCEQVEADAGSREFDVRLNQLS